MSDLSHTPTPQISFNPAQLKKMLSANNEAPLNVECIMDDIDVRGRLNREELEALVAPVLARLKAPMEKVGHHVQACLVRLWTPSAV